MSGLYKILNPDGSIAGYTDVPQSGSGTITRMPSGVPSSSPSEPTAQQNDFQLAKKVVSKAPSIIPTAQQYAEYLDYLRHHSPVRLDRVLQDLKKSDFKTWQKLQKYPQFRPLADTALGLKAGEKHLAAAIGLATGDITGAGNKWLATTVKDLMKRDRFGPYADVLGRQASIATANAAKAGKAAMAADMARNAAAAKQALKLGEEGRAAIRGGFAAAASRTIGTATNVFMEFLNPERAQDIAAAAFYLRAQKLYERGVLDEAQWAEVSQLCGQGKYVEAKALMDAAVDHFVFQK